MESLLSSLASLYTPRIFTYIGDIGEGNEFFSIHRDHYLESWAVFSEKQMEKVRSFSHRASEYKNIYVFRNNLKKAGITFPDFYIDFAYFNLSSHKIQEIWPIWKQKIAQNAVLIFKNVVEDQFFENCLVSSVGKDLTLVLKGKKYPMSPFLMDWESISALQSSFQMLSEKLA